MSVHVHQHGIASKTKVCVERGQDMRPLELGKYHAYLHFLLIWFDSLGVAPNELFQVIPLSFYCLIIELHQFCMLLLIPMEFLLQPLDKEIIGVICRIFYILTFTRSSGYLGVSMLTSYVHCNEMML